MGDLTFITGNEQKVKYLKLWLGRPFTHHWLDLHEIQSLDLHEVVEHKAKQAYDIVKKPVLVEDVALTFHAFGRLPGTLIKWFLHELGNEGLCQLLDGFEDRAAEARIVYALYDGAGMHYFEGVEPGRIAPRPQGQHAFGWNPIFIPTGSDKSFAEIPDDKLDIYNHRAQAVKKLKAFLDKNQA